MSNKRIRLTSKEEVSRRARLEQSEINNETRTVSRPHRDPARDVEDRLVSLDNEANAYVSAGLFDLALVNVRKMMRIAHPSDPRGYLRMGALLEQTKKPELALKAYNRALNLTKPGSKSRQQAESCIAEIEYSLSLPKRKDPMAVLPPELVAMILEYLDLKSTVRFSQVSKLWQGLGRSLSKRWFFLDFTCVTKPVPYSCVRGFIEVTNGGLKTAKLLNMVPRHLPRVVELVSRCVGLTDLLISQSGRIPFSKLALPNLETLNVLRSAKVALDTLLKVISSCPRLKEVAAIVLRPRNVNYTPPQVPQLQVLRLALCPNGGPGAFSAPFFKNGDFETKTPNLLTLDLHGLDEFDDSPCPSRGHPNLRYFSTTHLHWADFYLLPATLTSLFLIKSRISHMPNQAFDHFTCLESAWIEDCSAVTPALLRVLVSRNKATLKRLCLRWCPNIYREHIEPLMLKGLLEGVTTLSLRAILDVDDSLTPVIIETMPNLKVLDLHDTKITGYTLKQLADAKSPRLETFHVPRVSLDAIEYARSRNIKVLR